jgi:CDP-glycerol glycerophosphotransferase
VRLEAWAFIQNVDLSVQDQTVRAVAQAPGHEPVELPVQQYVDPEIDEFAGVSGSGHCDYRPGGVHVDLDLARLAPGTWEVELEITSGSVTRTIGLGRPWAGGTGSLRHGLVAGPGRAAVVSCRERRLQVRVYDTDVVVEQVEVQDGRVRLAGPGAAPATLVAQRRNAKDVAAVVSSAPDGGWSAQLDLGGQLEEGPPGTPTQWSFLAKRERRGSEETPVRFAVPDTDGPLSHPAPGWRALVGHHDQLLLRMWRAGAQVSAARVEDDAVVVELETFGLDLADYDVVFESRPRTCAAEVERDGDRVVCRLPFRERRWGRPDQVVLSTTYTPMLVERRSGERISPRVSPRLTDELPADVLTPLLRCKLVLRPVDQGALAVMVLPPLQPDERGFRNQLLLQERANSGSGSERSVFFRTLYGEATNDNNLAIHEELRRRGSDLTLYWAVKDHSVPLPEGAVPVLEESRAWHEALGDAGYVVLNVHQPAWYDKPQAQVMVETFHGYPYKGMGQSWWERSGFGPGRIAGYLERADHWDFLVSPAAYATPRLLAEFFTPEAAAKVQVLEVGYPRNDVLLRPEGEQLRQQVREALGIRPDQRAVLYAPTFRDYLSNDGMTAKSSDFFDARAAAKALGPDYVVLQRGHAFNARANEARVDAQGVVDVTYYPDIAELCLASDAAILDYSSLRFDYALTRKPMVFLVPDKELYHALRPAILDFEPTAPGPHVRTTQEAVAVLRDPDALKRLYDDKVETFISDYMELEDGHAAARVVDAVFGSGAAG